jgi:hypothetical protein
VWLPGVHAESKGDPVRRQRKVFGDLFMMSAIDWDGDLITQVPCVRHHKVTKHRTMHREAEKL